MTKEIYVKPETARVTFETVDVLTASRDTEPTTRDPEQPIVLPPDWD